jgi:hypothetical protein
MGMSANLLVFDVIQKLKGFLEIICDLRHAKVDNAIVEDVVK